MFALTPRLLLRPLWPEEAPRLAAAIGHEAVCRNLTRAPWPYRSADADAFVAAERGAAAPRFAIARRADAALIGGIGIHDGELGYWLAPDAWGRGYATEAGRAVVALARHTLRLDRLEAAHFADNPASARVLAKLGFRPTGEVEARRAPARDADAPCVRMRLDLAAPPAALAA
jgi:RimJ/RimL family protein N-acetyltransferase